MQAARVSTSLRHGITIESSIAVEAVSGASWRGRCATLMVVQRNAGAELLRPEKEVTPTDRLSGAGTWPCGPVPAPSNVSLGAVAKGKAAGSAPARSESQFAANLHSVGGPGRCWAPDPLSDSPD